MNDREWDKRLRIRTVGREDEANANYSPYEPTPYAVLQRLADSGHVRRRHHLLDYGCGKGSVAFFMTSVIGCRVTGIDHSEKLIAIARENRRACRAGDRVALARCLAEQYPIADEDAFFFFNPFSCRVFEGVLRRLSASWRERPRPLTLLFYYPSEEYLRVLDEAPELRRVDVIPCQDLFSGSDPRELIAVYAFPGEP